MRFSKFFAYTLKDAPRDCVLKSHEYLVRGGFIKQNGSGIYDLLPLGKIVLDKITAIVREEMNAAGAQEVALGFVTPAELWEKSGRLSRYGKELLVFEDRHKKPFVLGPTHEEAVVNCVQNLATSYKKLPLHLYQINLKFRDEIRPRFGLMRAREFVMKDGYSFHADFADLDREFEAMEATYRRIFARLGLDFRVVEAHSGSIGGSGSREFMILAPSGEDDIAVCESCDYAANIEVAKGRKNAPKASAPKAEFAKFHTPNITSAADLAAFFKTDSHWILKCVAKRVLFEEGASELAFFFLRGDAELSDTKALGAIIGAKDLVEISSAELANLGLFAGFIGPYALKNITRSRLVFFDEALREAGDLICGANERDYHFVGVNLAGFAGLDFADIAQVAAGDSCARCGGRLGVTKGIEVGHIFKLGTKYSSAMGATFMDENQTPRPYVMGCYGIGVSRIIAALLEQKSDDKGAVWGALAPFRAVIIVSNVKNQNELDYATALYENLRKLGLEVLLDDRDLRFGAKMNDFYLIGFANAIIVGKELQNGRIELVRREGLEQIALESGVSAEEIAARCR